MLPRSSLRTGVMLVGGKFPFDSVMEDSGRIIGFSSIISVSNKESKIKNKF